MTDILSELVPFREVMLEAQREKEREKVTIGFLFNIPPIELSEKDIDEYRRQVWINSMRVRITRGEKINQETYDNKLQ